jgi:hypothetical protein
VNPVVDKAKLRAALLALPLRKDLRANKTALTKFVDQATSMILFDLTGTDEKIPTPKQTAKQLDDVATALARLKVTLSKLQPYSHEEFAITTRQQRGVTRDLRTISKLVFKSELQSKLASAAKTIRSAPTNFQSDKTRALDVACSLASCYVLATGKTPGTGRGAGKLEAFVQSVFDVLGMKENAAYFADRAATVDKAEFRRLLAKLT